jgi:hypothetical protein
MNATRKKKRRYQFHKDFTQGSSSNHYLIDKIKEHDRVFILSTVGRVLRHNHVSLLVYYLFVSFLQFDAEE